MQGLSRTIAILALGAAVCLAPALAAPERANAQTDAKAKTDSKAKADAKGKTGTKAKTDSKAKADSKAKTEDHKGQAKAKADTKSSKDTNAKDKDTHKSKGKDKKGKKPKKNPAVVQSNSQAVKAAEEALRGSDTAKEQAAAPPCGPTQVRGGSVLREGHGFRAPEQLRQVGGTVRPGHQARRQERQLLHRPRPRPVMLGNLDKALDDYDKAIALNADDPMAVVMRGHTYLKKRDFAKAVQDFDKAVGMGYADADVYKGRGAAYGQMNQPQKMCEDFQAACKAGDCEMLEKLRRDNFCGN